MGKYDVVALGELLIDLTQNGLSAQGNPTLEANPGGAPCNVLALLSKLGHKTAFIGKVGQDGFGNQLEEALVETGISAEGLCRDKAVHTTLAVVHTFADGDRDFSFYRNPGADMRLTTEEVNMELIRQAKIFHFGTLSMTDEPVRSATYAAIAEAEKNGVLRSFDPNLRPPLWRTLEETKEQVLYGMAHCDILKISDNEIQWLTGLEDFDAGIRWIREDDSGAILVGEATRAGERHDDDKRVDTADVIRERMRQVSHIGGEKRAAHHLAQSVRSLDVVRAGVRRDVSESYSLLGELGVEFAQVGNLDEVLRKRAG